VEGGRIEPGSILLVESLDRLSRQNINIAVQLLLSIINQGIVVVTLMDGATYRADADPHQLMAQLMMSLAIFMRANDESRMKATRKADSWRAKREAASRGEYHGGRVPVWIEVVDGKYRIIESEVEKVRAIFRDYNNGWGLFRLSQKYGIPKPTIGYWLNNPVVMGTLAVKEGTNKIDIPDHYPAIIDQDTYELAQQRRGERYIHRNKARGSYLNLFAGLLFDPNGKRMIISQHNGGVRNYVSPGYIIRVRHLEECICTKLISRFSTTRTTRTADPDDARRLQKIEQEMKRLQAGMMEEPELASNLLPVLRKLQQQKRELQERRTTIRETVDISDVVTLLNDENNLDARLRLRQLAQQSIKQIRLTKIESENWFVLVAGIVTTTDGEKVSFRFAYCTRRARWIPVDQPPRDDVPFSMPPVTDRITDDLRRILLAMPKGR
jgi:DNA invertase Pin-like site-specific DNA recombinase